MDGVVTGAGVIFGLIGGLKAADETKEIKPIIWWLLSGVLGIVFGYLGLFGFAGGVDGAQAGFVAAMGISTANTFVNKVSNR